MHARPFQLSSIGFPHPRIHRPTLLLSGLLLALSSLSAQAVRYYDVEMILFENLDLSQVNNEVWPDVTEVGEPSALDVFGTRGDLLPTGPLFRPLGVANKRLGGTWARLRNSANYRPVLHLAWRQPGLGASRAIPVRIAGGRRYINPAAGMPATEPPAPTPITAADSRQPVRASDIGTLGSLTQAAPPEIDEIEGTVKVVLGRYLHVHTDLLFRRLMPTRFGIQPDPNAKPVTNDGTETVSPAVTAPSTSAQAAPSSRLTGFRMQQRRRMRSAELHYIDHPAFGMIVEIRRAPVADGGAQ